MPKKAIVPTPEMNALLRATASAKRDEADAAMQMLATALVTPLREGILSGDIISDIFVQEDYSQRVPEYPLDLLVPGREKDHTAYTIPAYGRIPEHTVESDYVMVPTYEIGNSIDWLLKYARDASWNIVNRAMEVFMGGFVTKTNNDGWHLILAAGVDRNIIVYDSAATAGMFTKRLVTLLKTNMRRNAGGNSTSVNRGILTDLYVSPECLDNIRDWGVDQIDEITRREIYMAADGSVNRIAQVNIHDIDELGEDQEYQDYFTTELGGALQAQDVQLVVGLDLRHRNSCFVNPIKAELEVTEDNTLHRRRKAGVYGTKEHGFGVLDSRCVLLGSC